MTIVAFFMVVIGSVLFVLSHANQNLLQESLSRPWRWVAYALLLISLLILLAKSSLLVAIFSWLIIMITVGSALPFISVLKDEPSHGK
ncbi:hypothetical protein [Brackiella oedipodis]|uniref:hypothetical protein n=1 Tax=Brackiella oedipodis TaxID=124225 RepID=UPI000571060E|nr:hypothetical protein [Brackiella oedipodis]